MKEPRKFYRGKLARFDPPDKEWLEHQYRTLDKRAAQIAKECKCHVSTVVRWMMKTGVQRRGGNGWGKLSGKNNPNWKDGSNTRYQRRILGADRVPVCAWCGSVENIQVHHLDHNRANNELGNLEWLCGDCNSLEAFAWVLQHKGNYIEIFINKKQTF